jgi:hypothetical protein
MKNMTSLLLIAAAAACLCVMPSGPGALARETADGYVLDSSPADLLAAHNERMLVVFGAKVEFKRYFQVGLLNQSMTVAANVAGGVRYDLRDSGRERTLTIP